MYKMMFTPRKAKANGRLTGMKEGMEARKEGRPCKSPYLRPDGNPIPMLLAFHEGWLLGWEAKDADLREKENQS